MAWRSSVVPRSLPDALGMAFMALAAPAAYLFELWVVLPARHPQPCLQLTLHRLIVTYLLFSVLANYLLVILVDTAPTDRPHSAASYCRLCRLYLPPRAWHCEACGRCILRRDHHCMLTGCCIGLHNYRYFFCLLTHVTAATLYGAALNLWYLGHITPRSLAGLTRLLLPALAYFLFPEPPRLLAERLFCMASVGMAVACCVLYGVYLRNLLAGQTMAERRKHHNPHPGRTVLENLRHSLGLRWPLVLLCPFLSSPLPDQGGPISHKPSD